MTASARAGSRAIWPSAGAGSGTPFSAAADASSDETRFSCSFAIESTTLSTEAFCGSSVLVIELITSSTVSPTIGAAGAAGAVSARAGLLAEAAAKAALSSPSGITLS